MFFKNQKIKYWIDPDVMDLNRQTYNPGYELKWV